MTRVRMRMAAAVVLAAATLVFGTAHARASTAGLGAQLSGSQEVPPNASPATGAVHVDVNLSNNSVCTNYTFSGLVGGSTAAHIHRAPAGTNGPVVIPIVGFPTGVTNGTGRYCAVVAPLLASDLVTNPSNFYFNVHSTALPGGEIRGQLATHTMISLAATLSGSNEVPPNSSPATGRVVVRIDDAVDQVCLTYKFANLTTSEIAAHIHQAPAGTNGPVVATVTSPPPATTAVVPDQCGFLTSAVIDNLVANPAGYYFNVHSSAFPGGEIRGQFHAASSDVAVTKTAASPSVAAGGDITYTINVSVTGDGALDATLTDPLPAGTTFVSLSSPPGWVSQTPAPGDPGTVTSTNPLADPGVHTFTLVVKVDPGIAPATLIANTATVGSDVPDPKPANNLATSVVGANCARTVTGNQSALTLSGGSWCVVGANINSSVTVQPGTTAAIGGSAIAGSVTANSPARFALCASKVASTLSVTGATGFVLIGDPGDDGCPGNAIAGNVTLSNNHNGVELSHNSNIGGSVTFNGNTGGGPFPDDVAPEIEANTIKGSLSCYGNSPAPTNDSQPNTVSGSRAGQCTTV